MRIIYAVWILTALILSTGYGSVFYSMMTVPKYGKPFDTLDEFVQIAKTDSHYIMLDSKSAFFQKYVNSTPDQTFYYEIGQHIKR